MSAIFHRNSDYASFHQNGKRAPSNPAGEAAGRRAPKTHPPAGTNSNFNNNKHVRWPAWHVTRTQCPALSLSPQPRSLWGVTPAAAAGTPGPSKAAGTEPRRLARTRWQVELARSEPGSGRCRASGRVSDRPGRGGRGAAAAAAVEPRSGPPPRVRVHGVGLPRRARGNGHHGGGHGLRGGPGGPGPRPASLRPRCCVQ